MNPTDHPTERAFVACALFDADAAQLVAETPPEAFDDGPISLIAQAVKALVETGRPADCVTVASILEDRGELAAAGGHSKLTMMEAELPDPSRAATYRQRVLDLYARRIAVPMAERGDWPRLQAVVARALDVLEPLGGRWRGDE